MYTAKFCWFVHTFLFNNVENGIITSLFIHWLVNMSSTDSKKCYVFQIFVHLAPSKLAAVAFSGLVIFFFFSQFVIQLVSRFWYLLRFLFFLLVLGLRFLMITMRWLTWTTLTHVQHCSNWCVNLSGICLFSTKNRWIFKYFANHWLILD